MGRPPEAGYDGMVDGKWLSDDFLLRSSYTVSDVASVLGISRTTLMWYEEIGIIKPSRAPGTGWRLYSAEDIYRLMAAFVLKNAGVRPSDIASALESDAFSHDKMQQYIFNTERREEYCRAQAESLRRLDLTIEKVGTVYEMGVEPYYISFDRSECGYKDYDENDKLLSELAGHMPIVGLGAVSQVDWPGRERSRWGRTVAVRHAHLVEFPVERQVIGGMRCACLPYVTCGEQNAFDSVVDLIQAYLDYHGLAVAGRCFCPYILPIKGGLCMMYCLPIAQAGG